MTGEIVPERPLLPMACIETQNMRRRRSNIPAEHKIGVTWKQQYIMYPD